MWCLDMVPLILGKLLSQWLFFFSPFILNLPNVPYTIFHFQVWESPSSFRFPFAGFCFLPLYRHFSCNIEYLRELKTPPCLILISLALWFSFWIPILISAWPWPNGGCRSVSFSSWTAFVNTDLPFPSGPTMPPLTTQLQNTHLSGVRWHWDDHAVEVQTHKFWQSGNRSFWEIIILRECNFLPPTTAAIFFRAAFTVWAV